MRPRLVAFDLDGTLIDSRRDLAAAANVLLASRGAGKLPVDRIVEMVGDGARRLVERAFAASGLGAVSDADVDEFVHVYGRHLFATTRPYDGVAEMLHRLRGFVPLALVTNKPVDPARRLLEHFGLTACFVEVIGGDGPYARKPDPQALRHAMVAVSATPDTTVLVGDSHVDVRTARAAGTRFCLARYGFGVSRLPEGLAAADDWAIDQPLDLLPLVGL